MWQGSVTAAPPRSACPPSPPCPSHPRRKPKENNFKAVLESIRDLMNEEVIIPPWLHDIFLGYGDPGAAHYTGMDPAQVRGEGRGEGGCTGEGGGGFKGFDRGR